MKDERQFKALVLQKVRQQQQQKQLRLQKRRALSITLSTLCVGIICVVSVLWIVSVSPSLQNNKDRGDGDDLTYAGSVGGTGATGTQNNNGNQSNGASIKENEGIDEMPQYQPDADGSDTPLGTEQNPFIDSIEDGTESGKENPGTTQGVGNTNGAVPSFLFNRLTLEGITPANAAALSLQNGVTENQESIAQLIRLAENCIGSETASDYDGNVLFVLRAESDTTQHSYTFYENGTLLVQKGERSTTYRTNNTALQTLQTTLQETSFDTN